MPRLRAILCKKKPTKRCLLGFKGLKKPKEYVFSLFLSYQSDAFTQEAEQEQDSIKEQFADLVRRKAEVDDAQKPLQDELNDIKKKILDFDQKRGVATVSSVLAYLARGSSSRIE